MYSSKVGLIGDSRLVFLYTFHVLDGLLTQPVCMYYDNVNRCIVKFVRREKSLQYTSWWEFHEDIMAFPSRSANLVHSVFISSRKQQISHFSITYIREYIRNLVDTTRVVDDGTHC